MKHKKKLAYPYDFYKTIKYYEKPIEEILVSGKKAYYIKVKNKCPDQEEIYRTIEIKKYLIFKMVES